MGHTCPMKVAFRFNVASLVVEERREWASFLRTLSKEQWDRPSLCDGWTVRDVVAHAVSYEEAAPLTVAGRFVRGGLRLSGANAVALRERGRCRRPCSSTNSNAIFGRAVLPECSAAASHCSTRWSQSGHPAPARSASCDSGGALGSDA